MYKIFLLIFSIGLSFSLFADNQKGTVLENTSGKNLYSSKLECQEPFTTGSFQNCSLKLFQNNKAVENTKIFLLGGMPQHKHGLPTSPKVIWSNEKDAYLIQGLKFSMPGEWLLDFKISAKEDTFKDNILITINVN